MSPTEAARWALVRFRPVVSLKVVRQASKESPLASEMRTAIDLFASVEEAVEVSTQARLSHHEPKHWRHALGV